MSDTHSNPPASPRPAPLEGTDLLSLTDLDAAQILELFRTARAFKDNPGAYRRALDGKHIVMLFEKPSLRTRITFDVGIAKLGGHAVYMDHAGQRLGEREAIKDYARNLERWVDAVVARVFSQDALEELAAYAGIPVINALSDRFHPCQALADFFTLQSRFGRLAGLRLAFIGDGNNVCHSLMHGAAILGVHMVVVTPHEEGPARDVVERCERLGSASGATLRISHDPGAVAGCDAVYTDAWVSMGQEAAHDTAEVFGRYQVNRELLARAGPGACVMHCLPAHRGEEATDEVLDGPTSLIYEQAENRMHAQNALLLHLLGAARV
ncbi:MAG: ornithine carbamoyltransferase [Phycisphaerales bacterium]|nr:ornithine carbamoyltransferase [Phycisphaerales bacterium]